MSYKMPIKARIKLFFFKIKCYYWDWRLPKDLNILENKWRNIDHRKDRSLSGKDFRFWLYLRKVDN
jgi:hypothetical protein